MNTPNGIDIAKFFLLGVNYKKSNASVRGSFAILPEQQEAILQKAAARNISEVMVLSTCNRTEIYGVADHPDQLAELLCAHTSGDLQTFRSLAYIKKGKEAIQHLFEVGAGLDSQILGDYEIVGQIRQAVKFAREKGMIRSFMERLTNQVLEASKEVKNQTALSNGTVSVSFAAVQYIREKCPDLSEKKVLLVGIGKIGRNTTRNLQDYLPTRHITLVNRSQEKATELAQELGLRSAPMEDLAQLVAESDIVLVATHAPQPIITAKSLGEGSPKWIIDMSIPCNVDPQVGQLNQVRLVSVDELSRMKDQTLQQRQAEVPKAREIILRHRKTFEQWCASRRHVWVLQEAKSKLEEIHTRQFSSQPTSSGMRPPEHRIDRVIKTMAHKMRDQHTPGCFYLEAINEFMAMA